MLSNILQIYKVQALPKENHSGGHHLEKVNGYV